MSCHGALHGAFSIFPIRCYLSSHLIIYVRISPSLSDAHKPNQDAFVAHHNFANRPTDAFFGVFDGHGNDGDKCAQFVRDNLPRILAEEISKARGEVVAAQTKNLAEGFGVGNNGQHHHHQQQQQRELSSSSGLSKESTHDIIVKSHNECNRQMRTSPDLDDSLSGTTSISVYLHGHRNRITISNVGDSRAVVGRLPIVNSENNSKEDGRTAAVLSRGGGASSSLSTKSTITTTTLKAYALSRDQTPHRRDERVRIRKTGARILSLDQIEGLEPIDKDDAEHDEEKWLIGARKGGGAKSSGEMLSGEMILGEELDEGGDPPRVWHPHGDYPGTAFTRSIGDAVAEELGVISDPEIISRNLTPEDKIIVLASDGVFEFLTNQSVIDICAKFADPLEACRAVVAESYELWLQYELRTDDITMICMFIDDVDSNKALRASATSLVGGSNESENLMNGENEKNSSEVDDELVTDSSRPLRTNMSVEKSRALLKTKASSSSMDSANGVSEDEFDIESLYHEKSHEEKLHIDDAIRGHLVFQNLTDVQRELLYKVLVPTKVKKGEWVIRQGTHGDHFYIVDEGSFEVRILSESATENDGATGGDCVHVYEGSREMNFHPSFGELALKYSAPRAASIIARTDGHLWALHRYAFKQIIADQGEEKRNSSGQ